MATKAMKASKAKKDWRKRRRWWSKVLSSALKLFHAMEFCVNLTIGDAGPRTLWRSMKLAARLKRIGNKKFGEGWWGGFESSLSGTQLFHLL